MLENPADNINANVVVGLSVCQLSNGSPRLDWIDIDGGLVNIIRY